MKYIYDKEFDGIVETPNCVDECLEMIRLIGYDYDGANSIKDCKCLIDELIDYANMAREFLKKHELYPNEEISNESYLEAMREKHEAREEKEKN